MWLLSWRLFITLDSSFGKSEVFYSQKNLHEMLGIEGRLDESENETCWLVGWLVGGKLQAATRWSRTNVVII